MKPRRVDVFGEQNLKRAVEDALSSGYNRVDEEDLSIKLRRKTEEELGSTFPYFDALFNPVDGAIREAPEELSYSLTMSRTMTMVYESTLYSRSVELSGEEIRAIQEGSRQAAKADEYSEEEFRALYERARRGDLEV